MIKQTAVTIVVTTLKGKELEDAIVWFMRPLYGDNPVKPVLMNAHVSELSIGKGSANWSSSILDFSVENTMFLNELGMKEFAWNCYGREQEIADVTRVHPSHTHGIWSILHLSSEKNTLSRRSTSGQAEVPDLFGQPVLRSSRSSVRRD